MQGDYQRVNAGLAVALASTWLQNKRRTDRGDDESEASMTEPPVEYAAALEPVVRDGLKNALWPGRSHIMDDAAFGARYFIDGAHTLRSLECSAEWFRQSVAKQAAPTKRALIFTIHHERNVAHIFAPLLQLPPFDRVYFCPTSSSRPSVAKVHNFSEALEEADFASVLQKYSAEELAALDDVSEASHPWHVTLSRPWRALKTHVVVEDQSQSCVAVKDSVVDCIADLRADVADGEQQQRSVLVTGSLYLASETLDLLG